MTEILVLTLLLWLGSFVRIFVFGETLIHTNLSGVFLFCRQTFQIWNATLESLRRSELLVWNIWILNCNCLQFRNLSFVYLLRLWVFGNLMFVFLKRSIFCWNRIRSFSWHFLLTFWTLCNPLNHPSWLLTEPMGEHFVNFGRTRILGHFFLKKM